MVMFGSGKRTPEAKHVEVCLNYHSKAIGKFKGMKWQGSVHAERSNAGFNSAEKS